MNSILLNELGYDCQTLEKDAIIRILHDEVRRLQMEGFYLGEMLKDRHENSFEMKGKNNKIAKCRPFVDRF